jgi:hypothetical protein
MVGVESEEEVVVVSVEYHLIRKRGREGKKK